MHIMDAERVRKIQTSIAASSVFPGFRFSPTDQELISYYLKKKLEGSDNCVDIIPEVDFCRHEPRDLPAISIIQSDNEWFFFSARGRKYPNGSQSKRATESGYWKATGKERNVKSGSTTIGTKRTLVFHTGRAPKGERTEWIMHEYCMSETSQDSLVVCRLRRNSDFRIDGTPRGGGSLDQRNFSAGDNSASATNEYEIPQMGIVDGAKAIESCSKECTSSYTSHSVQQNDSDRELINDSPQGSCSRQKDREDEDDIFADIMKDNIVQLNESSMTRGVLPLVSRETEAQVRAVQIDLIQGTMSRALPLQGTADRSIRLRHQKVTIQQSEGEPAEENKGQQSSSCVSSGMTDMVDVLVQRRSVSLILVIFSLLVLVLFVPWPPLGKNLQGQKVLTFPFF